MLDLHKHRARRAPVDAYRSVAQGPGTHEQPGMCWLSIHGSGERAHVLAPRKRCRRVSCFTAAVSKKKNCWTVGAARFPGTRLTQLSAEDKRLALRAPDLASLSLDICRLPLEGIKSICYCMLTPNSQSCGRVKCVLSRIGIAGNLRTNLDQAFSPTMLFSSVMTESSCKPHSLPRRIRGPCVGEYIISRNRLGPAHLQHA